MSSPRATNTALLLGVAATALAGCLSPDTAAPSSSAETEEVRLEETGRLETNLMRAWSWPVNQSFETFATYLRLESASASTLYAAEGVSAELLDGLGKSVQKTSYDSPAISGPRDLINARFESGELEQRYASGNWTLRLSAEAGDARFVLSVIVEY